MNNTLRMALTKASRNLSVDRELVESVYKSYWFFIKELITNVPIREMSREELESTVSNINLPFLGKLYASGSKLEGYKRQIKHNQDVKAKKSEASRLSGVSD